MTMSDPIADMLTRIRNANTAKHDTVDVPSSKMKLAIAQILLDEGYIKKYDIVEDGGFKSPVYVYMPARKICLRFLAVWVLLLSLPTRVLSPTRRLVSFRLAAKY